MLELMYLLVNVISSQNEPSHQALQTQILTKQPTTTQPSRDSRNVVSTPLTGFALENKSSLETPSIYETYMRPSIHETKDTKRIVSDNHVVCRQLSLLSQPGLLAKGLGGEISTLLTK